MTDVLEVSNNIRGLNVESAEAQLRRLAEIYNRTMNGSIALAERIELKDEFDAILANWLG